MKTISEVIEKMPRRTYASRAGYRQAVKRACLRLTGCEPIPAATDRAGNCLVCGEAGRCCGLHLFGEISLRVSQ